MHVEVYALVGGEDTRLGAIRWDGHAFAVEPDVERVRRLLGEPVYDSETGEGVTAGKEPERFLQLMPFQYRSPYFRVVAGKGEAEEDSLNAGKSWTPEDEQKHPRGEGGKFAPKGSGILQAFRKLDSSGHNHVALSALRAAMPHLDRESFDAAIHALRREGVLSLAAYEGRNAGSEGEDAVRSGSIREGDSLLAYASVRDAEKLAAMLAEHGRGERTTPPTADGNQDAVKPVPAEDAIKPAYDSGRQAAASTPAAPRKLRTKESLLAVLADNKPRTLASLAALAGFKRGEAQPHLAELEASGAVEKVRKGSQTLYRLTGAAAKTAVESSGSSGKSWQAMHKAILEAGR